MPAKTRKSRMAMPMQAAENMDMNDTCFKVRGRDMTMPISVTMTANETVQREWSDSVLSTLAPVRTWKPMSMMLFASSINAVKW
jgi:hypothetical protein